LGIIRLVEARGEFLIENACEIVNKSGEQNYRKLKQVLDSDAFKVKNIPLNHENIRGRNYYN
jgi:hypothetical protein